MDDASLDPVHADLRGCVACIGVFDGVHRGHQALVALARSRADLAGLPLVAITFDPHPMEVVRPGEAPTSLATLAQRIELLHDAGAVLFIADVNGDNLKMALDAVPATVVSPSEVIFTDVDVLAPCALGNILTSTTIPKIRAKVIAGAANNQLATPADGLRLAQREILYAPDYVINAGGIICVAHEYYGHASEDDVRADVGRIKQRLADLFQKSADTGRPTNELADELARKLVAEAR